MAQDAFHSINESDPDVYHWCKNCGPGQQIPKPNLREGTGPIYYRECENCRTLADQDGCQLIENAREFLQGD